MIFRTLLSISIVSVLTACSSTNSPEIFKNTDSQLAVAPAISGISGISVIDPDETIQNDDKDWNTVVFLEMADNTVCTGTLVGKDTLLTAAHCVDARNRGTPAELKEVVFRFGGRFHPYECTMTPEYANEPLDAVNFRGYFDVALCKALIPDRLPQDLIYQNIDQRSIRTSNTKITIAGYGCSYEINPETGLQDFLTDTKLRTGTAEIGSEILAEPNRFLRDGHFRTLTRRNDQSADACQGDSGGPVLNERNGIIAVVSGAGFSPAKQKHLSRYADLSHANVVNFMHQWLANNPDQKICGVLPRLDDIDHHTSNCR